MIRMLYVSVLAVLFVSCFTACAGRGPVPLSPTADMDGCERLFREMDRQLVEHGVSDAGASPIADFPALRVDRFLASFANQALTEQAYAAWLERLRALDQTARMIEWRNLPPTAVSRLRDAFGADVEAKIKPCGSILAEPPLSDPIKRSRLLDAVEPPDAYSAWQRIFGLYFLSRWAIVDGVWRVQRELRAPFIEPHQAQAVQGRQIRYSPPNYEAITAAEVALVLEQSREKALGIPVLYQQQVSRLFSAFAPVWAVDTRDDNDYIGAAQINSEGKPYIDTHRPSVYRLVSYTRYGGQILLQLNYVIWFSARPAESGLDIYAGDFDGLIWRVTLGPDGKPLAYDSIHPCGCYYQIFPGEGMKVVQPMDGSEPILSPMPILGVEPEKRLLIRLSAGNHFVTGITEAEPDKESLPYGWRDYDELRSLPMPGGLRRSMFDSDGLVPGSERLERFLLWPMGVPSAGAMRQWGTHAIAFLGKRHFDDPWLLEKLIRPLWQ